jgi:hypothetical protein
MTTAPDTAATPAPPVTPQPDAAPPVAPAAAPGAPAAKIQNKTFFGSFARTIETPPAPPAAPPTPAEPASPAPPAPAAAPTAATPPPAAPSTPAATPEPPKRKVARVAKGYEHLQQPGMTRQEIGEVIKGTATEVARVVAQTSKPAEPALSEEYQEDIAVLEQMAALHPKYKEIPAKARAFYAGLDAVRADWEEKNTAAEFADEDEREDAWETHKERLEKRAGIQFSQRHYDAANIELQLAPRQKELDEQREKLKEQEAALADLRLQPVVSDSVSKAASLTAEEIGEKSLLADGQYQHGMLKPIAEADPVQAAIIRDAVEESQLFARDLTLYVNGRLTNQKRVDQINHAAFELEADIIAGSIPVDDERGRKFVTFEEKERLAPSTVEKLDAGTHPTLWTVTPALMFELASKEFGRSAKTKLESHAQYLTRMRAAATPPPPVQPPTPAPAAKPVSPSIGSGPTVSTTPPPPAPKKSGFFAVSTKT